MHFDEIFLISMEMYILQISPFFLKGIFLDP